MKKILKYTGIAIGIVVVFAIITNPSPKQFKEYLGVNDKEDYFDITIKRTHNFFIFSIYKFDYVYTGNYDDEEKNEDAIKAKKAGFLSMLGNYYGVFSNFYLKTDY